ncbi:MAG TPA: hypothetical protein VN930_00575 [Xanthobacteraceae bacterium]|nr:hypothetical protein [Xanthobacteraceae bacterium]
MTKLYISIATWGAAGGAGRAVREKHAGRAQDLTEPALRIYSIGQSFRSSQSRQCYGIVEGDAAPHLVGENKREQTG